LAVIDIRCIFACYNINEPQSKDEEKHIFPDYIVPARVYPCTGAAHIVQRLHVSLDRQSDGEWQRRG
jgi:hypothetical protein